MASIAHVIRNRTFEFRFPNTAEVALDGTDTDYVQFSTWNAPEKGGNTLQTLTPIVTSTKNWQNCR